MMKASFSTAKLFGQLSKESGHVISSEELAILQDILLSMLNDLNDVCERNSIGYMLVFGSCLGALRHKGFIPWDDDLDVAMFRKDFNKFKSIFNEELGPKYVLQIPGETAGYDLAFPRMRLKGTTMRTRDDYYMHENCGIWIDLFVWEGVPNNVLLRTIHGTASLALGFAYSCRRFAKYNSYYLKLADNNESIKNVFRVKAFIGRLLSFASAEQFALAWYSWNALLGDKDTRYVCIPVAYAHYFGGLRSREILSPVRATIFGDLMAPVPGKSEVFLDQVYGTNWCQVPPESEHDQHVVLELDFGDYDGKR